MEKYIMTKTKDVREAFKQIPSLDRILKSELTDSTYKIPF